ncbi:hypothetical protein BaRGS_00033908 [Batillaria attramentaria]|uniref:Uncharacterized protein n=1 Tax=Batillaria attramentaria TaxID=370345 RepID=A0ABD0JIT9_9CAEN
MSSHVDLLVFWRFFASVPFLSPHTAPRVSAARGTQGQAGTPCCVERTRKDANRITALVQYAAFPVCATVTADRIYYGLSEVVLIIEVNYKKKKLTCMSVEMAVSPERPATASSEGSPRDGGTSVKSQMSSKASAFSIAAIIGNNDSEERKRPWAVVRSISPTDGEC